MLRLRACAARRAAPRGRLGILTAGGGGGGGRGAGPAVAMNESVVRRTQECLGQVIRKPPLTDRLLSKPPFRYLHDVITEVGRGPACGPALLLLGNRASLPPLQPPRRLPLAWRGRPITEGAPWRLGV